MHVDRFRPASGALALDGDPEPRPLLVARLRLGEPLPELRRVPELQGRALPRARRASAGGDDGRGAPRTRARSCSSRGYDDPEQHLVYRRGRLGREHDGRGQRDDRDPRAQPRAARRGARRGPRRSSAPSGRRSPRSTNVADGTRPPRLRPALRPRAPVRRPSPPVPQHVVASSAAASSTRRSASTQTGPSSVAEVAGDLPVVTGAERKRVKGEFDARAARRGRVLARRTTWTRARTTSGARGGSSGSRCATSRCSATSTSVRRASPPTAATAPWLMLLGENGCGKSSLLQAVALALMGAEERAALGLDARSYVRNGTRGGLVRVHLAGSQEPIELRFTRSSAEFRGGEEPKLILLAYGATRLLPGPGHEADAPDVVARAGAEPLRPVLADRERDRVAARARRPHVRGGRARAQGPARARDRRPPDAQPARAPRRRRGVRPARPARGPERRLPVGRRARDRPDDLAARALAERRRRRGHGADRRARRAPPPALADADRPEPAPGLPARAVPLLHPRPALPPRARETARSWS